MQRTKARLGDRLLERGLVGQDQLTVALSEQRRAYRPLGEILVSLGFVRPEDIAALLAEDLGLEVLRAGDIEPDPLLLAAVDRDFVRSSGSLPVRLVDGVLTVAMTDPGDPARMALVRARFPYPLRLAVTTESDLIELLRQHFSESRSRVAEIFSDLGEDAGRFGDDFPVEEITRALLVDGVQRGATDVHIEPEEKVTRVRYRVDGILHQGENLPRSASDAIVSRIKVLARLDISERRRPQDGRLRLDVDERDVDMRVSVMPCAEGENVVLRVLDRSAGGLQLPQLGFSEREVGLLRRVGERPHGLFLVTGPTGSGKTTTLYGVLAGIDAMRRNVVTVEDPIEYRLPLVRQSQIDPSIGFGFQEGLRALLRQDPDVILVGEIRDAETANMAIKASMTGHLVFSTLHTNSALGAIPRLSDLGVDPFLVEDSLIGVLAQRLVRRLCRHCSLPGEPDAHEHSFLQGESGGLMRAAGCERCRETGFSGRVAISELFLPDDSMADGLRRGVDLSELRRLAEAGGFEDLTVSGRRKVLAGLTSVAEVERVSHSHRFTVEEREVV
ncbi:MAG TPA: ATPase, T2SS/T4P/T4SS family [Planctomycetota bacterium]|nr:ATPase, T2SS/T4P/T4SS family [Planctomycetota bacterium]